MGAEFEQMAIEANLQADPDFAGRTAYESYCASSQGVSLVSGAKLPDWVDLPAQIKVAWIAAAQGVLRLIGA